MTHATRSSYAPALEALRAFKKKAALSSVQSDLLVEIERRLKRLDDAVGELIEINNKLIDQNAPRVSFDPATDTLTVQVPGGEKMQVKLQRANTDVPMQMQNTAFAGAYHAGVEEPSDEVQNKLQKRLEDLVEHYYGSAHRVLKLMQKLPWFKKFECRAITIVRNKLVEHPGEDEPYAFGYGTNGPIVRPATRSPREWHDAGAVRNTEEFIAALAGAFKRAEAKS